MDRHYAVRQGPSPRGARGSGRRKPIAGELSPLDPGTFNNFLDNAQQLRQLFLSQPGLGGMDIPLSLFVGFKGRFVKWDVATRYVSNLRKLKFNTYGNFRDSVTDPERARDILDEALCGSDPRPVIVGVTAGRTVRG